MYIFFNLIQNTHEISLLINFYKKDMKRRIQN